MEGKKEHQLQAEIQENIKGDGKTMSLNVTVICVEEHNPGKGATLGKPYKVLEGKITYDNGEESFRKYESIDELNSLNTTKFKELKKKGRPRKS